MKCSDLFTGRAFSVFKNNVIEEGEPSYNIIQQISLKSKEPFDISKLIDFDQNENFDHYVVESGEKSYSIRVSLDKDNPNLLNEIDFYKNNKLIQASSYVDSGVIRIGSDILFLICEFDEGEDITELGSLSVLEYSTSLFFTLKRLNESKTDKTFLEFLKLNFDRTNLEDEDSVFYKLLETNYELQFIKDVFSLLREEIYESIDSRITDSNKCCHGNLNLASITTRDGLYKVRNLDFTHLGNPIFDICNIILNCGFNKAYSLSFFEKYCKYNSFDFLTEKENFDHIMRIATALYYHNLLFDYLLETSVFECKRPEKLLNISLQSSKSFNYLKKLKCSELVYKTIEKILVSPVVDGDNPAFKDSK